ncbi:MAG: hypothetical protein IMX02_02780 [Limnochordaceae bacterium]|nr:hypothetical protein [Limnochordaceae bacterium]
MRSEGRTAFLEHLQWVNALRPEVGPRWTQRDYHVIETESRWMERVAVTLEDVRAELVRLGFDIPAGTLYYWKSRGLLPAPRRFPKSEGRGMLADWPPHTVAEAAAAKVLLDRLRARIGEIKAVRELVHEAAEDQWTLLRAADDPLWPMIREWLIVAAKVQAGFPLDQPAEVRLRGLRDGRPVFDVKPAKPIDLPPRGMSYAEASRAGLLRKRSVDTLVM